MKFKNLITKQIFNDIIVRESDKLVILESFDKMGLDLKYYLKMNIVDGIKPFKSIEEVERIISLIVKVYPF